MPLRDFSWATLPDELIVKIFEYLPYKALVRCTQVCQHWNNVSRDDLLWKPLLELEFFWWRVLPKITGNYFDEFAFFKSEPPIRLAETIDDYNYKLKLCFFSPAGKYFAVCGVGAQFCLYLSEPREFLHERCLKENLKWKEVRSGQFSPDEEKILLSGIRQDGSGEVAVFSICPETFEVHYLSRTGSNPIDFGGCWFDNNHILIGELYTFQTESPIASSISQIWISSVPKHANDYSEFVLCPLLRFLNKSGGLCKLPIVSSFVSSRFRRVLQMTEQAAVEGKTLSDKLNELELVTAITMDGDMTELKKVLDMEQQCFRCYLKHQLTQEEYGADNTCSCLCHDAIYRMLIYVTGEYSERVCFKMIDDKLISDAFAMKRFNIANDEGDAEDGWDYIMKRVDQPDYHLDFGGSIDHITLSPDQKQLIVALETVDRDFQGEVVGIVHQLRLIDLEKMIVDPIPMSGSMKPIGKEITTCSAHFAAGFTSKEVLIWSRDHRGAIVRKINVGDVITCIALDPVRNTLLTTSDMQLKVWTK